MFHDSCAILFYIVSTNSTCPGFFFVNGSITCNQAALLMSFWCHWFKMTKFFPNLVNNSWLHCMVNYVCGFNQSEMGKYFEWIINGFIIYRHECFTGKYTTRKIHKNYIRNPSGLFSIISHVSLSMTQFQ